MEKTPYKKVPEGTKVIIKDPITRTPVDGVVIKELRDFVDVEYSYSPGEENSDRTMVSGKPFKAITIVQKEKIFIRK